MTFFGIVIKLKNLFKLTWYLFLGYFGYLMVLITAQYFPLDFEVAFLRIKQDEIQLSHYQISFFTHVYTSILTLLLGFFQFSKTLRNKHPIVHRNIGKFYIIYSQISFCLLAVLWIYFSVMAYVYARKKNWTLHKNFIYRSYALTLSAISLRLFKWVIVGAFELPPMDTYKIVSWLGWIVNLVIAELLIRFKK